MPTGMVGLPLSVYRAKLSSLRSMGDILEVDGRSVRIGTDDDVFELVLDQRGGPGW